MNRTAQVDWWVPDTPPCTNCGKRSEITSALVCGACHVSVVNVKLREKRRRINRNRKTRRREARRWLENGS